MRRFNCRIRLICPSDWTEASVRQYLERIAPTVEEKRSIRVQPLPEEFGITTLVDVVTGERKVYYD